MVNMNGVCFIISATLTYTQKQLERGNRKNYRSDLWLNSLSICVECTVQYAETYPVEERNVIKQVRVGKGKNSQHLTQPWALSLQESDREREKDIFLFINDNISFSAGGEVM